MGKIFRYTLSDLLRSYWTYLYSGFFLLFTAALFAFAAHTTNVIISLMNVMLVLCPLIAAMFGVMYYYSSRDFIELLLAQPLRRRDIFLGQYLGLSVSLSLGWVIGVSLPFIAWGGITPENGLVFALLLFCGVVLTAIFAALAFWIALKNENRIMGFGKAILLWLFFAVIYDGLVLLLLIGFKDYPLEGASIALSMLNPVDLTRILLLLQLDISALMGFTGAVFRQFMGTYLGMLVAIAALSVWVVLPVWRMLRVLFTKDF
ncbi:MAG: ABC-2 transporter permease [Saprospiraceae bacterium]